MPDTWKQRLAPYLPAATILGTLIAMLALAVVYIGSLINAQTKIMESRFEAMGRSISELKESTDFRFNESKVSTDLRFGVVEKSIHELKASTDTRFEAVDTRIDDLETSMGVRFESLERLIIALDKSVTARIAGLEKTLDARFRAWKTPATPRSTASSTASTPLNKPLMNARPVRSVPLLSSRALT